MVSCAAAADGNSQPSDGDEPNQGRELHERLRASIRAHSSSVTGMTESLAMRTSGNDAKLLSALISASVTGRFSRLSGTDVDDGEFSRRVAGIRIRVTRRLGDGDHGLFLARVVVEDAVTAPDRAQMFLGERISHAGPDRLAVLLELVVPVVLRFFLHQPLRHVAIISWLLALGSRLSTLGFCSRGSHSRLCRLSELSALGSRGFRLSAFPTLDSDLSGVHES